jgi:hypothetical protein
LLDIHTEKYGIIRKSFVFASCIIIIIMRQTEELTSKKLMLGIMVALTSVSATTTLILPTYATTTTTTNVPDTTTGFDDIPSEEDVRNLITGAITDALQQNIQITQRDSSVSIPAGSTGDASASCPSGAPLTGGGFLTVGNLRVTNSFPLDENTWRASAINEDPSGSGDGILTAFALCLVVSE